MLKTLGAFAHLHRRAVVAMWIAIIAVLAGLVGTFGNGFSTQFNLPNVESAEGFSLLEERFGSQASGRSGTVVVQSTGGPFSEAQRQALNEYFAQLDARSDMGVVSPFTAAGSRQIAPSGDIAFANVSFIAELDSAEEFEEVFAEMKAIEPVVAGVQIEYGGEVFAEFETPTSEVLGLAFAIVILIFAFGSVLAMGLPIGTAFGGIAAGVLVATLVSNIFTMPDFATTLGVMIGLGVGIDYALFIVTRYREARQRGGCAAATVEAIDTAGRAVLFAGTTVVISLLGMLIMGVGFMNGLAIGASITVLFTMMASVTLLPALLGFVGERIEVTRWRGVIAAGLVAVTLVGVGLKQNPLLLAAPVAGLVLLVGSFIPFLRRPLPARRHKPMPETMPYRWSRAVQRRPWVMLIVGVVALGAIAMPVLDLRLGFADEGNYPTETTTRRAYDLLATGFGAGFNGPLTLVAAVDSPAQLVAAQQLSDVLATTPGVVSATPAIANDAAAPTAVLWTLYPTGSPQSQEAADLVARLRNEVIPAAVGESGLGVKVTGSVAVNVDFSRYLADRLPVFFGVVLALSFLLLMAVFRSLLVPLKAVLMNLLSIGSAYGAVVAVFQWGWGASLIGLGGSAPIDPWLPVMMFAIVFGLSMDYEVFLLSRVKEEYDRTGDNQLAVADGLAKTARVITAAAAIMVVVFGSFVLDATRSIKMFGFGLAVAVFLDATVVRLVLVPATMELLGDRNWWLPRWLDRLIPKIDVEGASEELVGEELVSDERATDVAGVQTR